MDFEKYILDSELNKTYIFSAGQAGYIIKSKSGQLLGIDLYLSDCTEEYEGAGIDFKRLLPKILSDNFELDYLIATHAHPDHFDYDAIPNLMNNNKTILFTSTSCEELVNKYNVPNIDRIYYEKPGNARKIGDFTIHFVSCDHGEAAPDAFGVVIEVDNKIIYEAGDTCLRLDRCEEYKSFGNIDIAIAPINGHFGNMNEKECLEFCKKLNTKYIIPCHYGMFANHGGSPELFLKYAKEMDLYSKVLLLYQGERIEI